MSSDKFGWIWAHRKRMCTSAFILLQPSAVKSSINSIVPVPVADICPQVTLLSCRHLTEVDFCFISPQNFVPELCWFCFVNCNLPFLFLRLGFASCSKSLSFRAWNLIFIINKETCSPTYWRELLTCCAVMNVSFITMHMIFSIYQVICSFLVSLWAAHFIKCTQLSIMVNHQPN